EEAKAALADAEAAIAKAQQVLSLHEATVAAIGAAIASLQWQLDQTKLLAPADGTITQLTLRVGDQAVENKPLIGLVDAHAWRIYANYKESLIRLCVSATPPGSGLTHTHGISIERRSKASPVGSAAS